MKISPVITFLWLSVFSSPLHPSESSGKEFLLKGAMIKSQSAATLARFDSANAGFESFKKGVFKEPFKNGVYIVNGDTPITNDEDLKEFYYREVVTEWKSRKFGASLTPYLIVDFPNDEAGYWDSAEKKNLTYCVSKAFGNHYAAVVTSMKSAAAAWESSSNVKFKHLESFDKSCDESTAGVVFDVRPVDVGAKYYARAFYPLTVRSMRNLMIDQSALSLAPNAPKKLTLVGVLRHELGHVLSFRHEYTRPESGRCFRHEEWKPVTDYDAFSVMQYPDCSSLIDWTLNLTETDKFGAACVYGVPLGMPPLKDKCRSI